MKGRGGGGVPPTPRFGWPLFGVIFGSRKLQALRGEKRFKMAKTSPPGWGATRPLGVPGVSRTPPTRGPKMKKIPGLGVAPGQRAPRCAPRWWGGGRGFLPEGGAGGPTPSPREWAGRRITSSISASAKCPENDRKIKIKITVPLAHVWRRHSMSETLNLHRLRSRFLGLRPPP